MPTVIGSKSKKRNKSREDDEGLIATSFKRFQLTSEAESDKRKMSLEDLKFSIGTGQWDEQVKANREIEGKPCLTLNRAPAFLRQYTGEERQHRPAMIVNPVGSGADQDTAAIHQGVLRHIESVSDAENVYDDSYDMMMRIGWCPWRITSEFVDEMSFDQEPRIRSGQNPFAFYLSPVRGIDGNDPLWAHVVEDLSREQYESQFGKTDLINTKFASEMGTAPADWVTKDGVRIAEYWWIELVRDTLYQLEDGTTCLKKDLDDREVVQERETIIRKVNCVKHDAIQVLKRYEYLGKYIPIPEVSGVKLNVNGKIHCSGMVRDYRDAQRIYDFMVTRAVEQVDMTTKDPLWVAKENSQWDEDYRQMNRKNFSHMYFAAYDEQGRQLPAPARAGRDAPIGAMQAMIQQADYDMKAIVGIYGQTLGDPANPQESGVAIMSRQEQADTGAVTWHEQLNRAIKYQGKILLDLWPKLISPARVQRVIKLDDSVAQVVVYNGQDNQQAAAALINPQGGITEAYDVSIGKYDVTLSSGPMYKSARQEAFKALTTLITAEPQLIATIGDIWAKNADFAQADVLANRFRKMLPPNLQEDDGGQDKDAALAQKDSQLQALSSQHDQMLQELNRAADTIRTKRLDLESKERIALLNAKVQLTLQAMQDHAEGAQAHLEETLKAITMQSAAMNAGETIEQDAGEAPQTPELPGAVQPRTQQITPGPPTPPRPQPINGGQQ